MQKTLINLTHFVPIDFGDPTSGESVISPTDWHSFVSARLTTNNKTFLQVNKLRLQFHCG